MDKNFLQIKIMTEIIIFIKVTANLHFCLIKLRCTLSGYCRTCNLISRVALPISEKQRRMEGGGAVLEGNKVESDILGTRQVETGSKGYKKGKVHIK